MTSNYGAEQIQVLEGIEHVRKRPGMYIGSTGPRGLHHLVYEVVDNSVDEALAGYCKEIQVTLNADGSVTVIDDGRGIPTEVHPRTGKSTLETVMTVLGAGGKFGGGGYKVSGGLHGVGISVVNALSEWVEARVWRDKHLYVQRFERGVPKTKVESQPTKESRTGTEVSFLPDTSIFSTGIEFDYPTLAGRLRELAFLNGGVKIVFTDRRLELLQAEEPHVETYFYEGGIREYVSYLNQNKEPLHAEIIYISSERNNVQVEVALQWCVDAYSDNLLGFANNIRTIDGGTHLEGLKTVLTRTLNSIARKRNKLKENDSNLAGENIREGLTGVISVKVPDPEFEGQTKTKLGNTEVRGIVDSLVGEVLTEYLEFRPQVADTILEKAIQAFNAAEAARRARELVRRKSVLESSTLPGKLADCSSKDPSESEIFLVEGDSAGGCFSGDTLVALADGRHLSFKQLEVEQAQGKEHFCYTIRRDGSIGIERILHPRRTKIDAAVIKVTLDNGEEIICTPDHRFMLRDGSYKQAAQLSPDDSLMPLYRKVSDRREAGITIDGYEMVWSPRVEDRKSVAALKQIEIDRGFLDLDAYRSYRLQTGDKSLLKFETLCDRYFEGNIDRAKAAVANYNHRVVSIEPLTERIDVYDIEVPHTHNFALASGVFVHNSAKQGRDRRFQAILPLRGKILNIEKTDDSKIYKNNEIQSLITALGLGIKGEEFDASQLRYHRIVIMSVAGDEPTLVMKDNKKTEFVKIGEFIDECVEGKRNPDRYQVMSFDPETKATRFRPIKAVIRHPHEEAMYRITTRYNRSIKVTSSHSVFVYEDEQVKLKKGNEIRADDILVASRFLPRPEKHLTRIDLLQTFCQAGETNALYVQGEDVRRIAKERVLARVSQPSQWSEPRIELEPAGWKELAAQRQAAGVTLTRLAESCNVKHGGTIGNWERGLKRPILSHFLTYLEEIGWDKSITYRQLPPRINKYLSKDDKNKNASWREVSCIKAIDELTNPELAQLGDDIQLVPRSHPDRAFDRYFPITKEFMWFLGWYVAQGVQSNHHIKIYMGKRGETFIEPLSRIIEKLFGETPRCHSNEAQGKFFELSFSSVAIARLLRAWGLNKRSHEKKIPDLIFSLPEKLQLAFLEAYFLGDGAIDRDSMIITTASEELKDGLMYVLGQLGIVAGTGFYQHHYPPNTRALGKRPHYIVRIAGKEQIERLRPLWRQHMNAANLEAHLLRPWRQPQDYLPIGKDLMGLRVVTAEEIDPVGEYVYDFSVEGDENFICGVGGLCAHNTDADVDGAHIRTLLLTFFYRYQRSLVESGYIYIACPPLYKVERGRNHYYCYSDRELQQQLGQFPANASYTIQRFKGLGEMMPQQLWDTTMNPETRMMKRVEIEDLVEADRIFTVLMGDRVAPRREFIETYGPKMNLTDLDI